MDQVVGNGHCSKAPFDVRPCVGEFRFSVNRFTFSIRVGDTIVLASVGMSSVASRITSSTQCEAIHRVKLLLLTESCGFLHTLCDMQKEIRLEGTQSKIESLLSVDYEDNRLI